MENKPSNFVSLPGAIIIAGALIAIAILFVKSPTGTPTATTDQSNQAKTPEINIAPVTISDHILGNPNAIVKIIEFSDTSCPYCKSFNPTMVDLMKQYGDSGKVAWIYRSYPLDKPDINGRILHPNSNHEAQALECAADIGGNTAFWTMEKSLYETTPAVTQQTPNGLDQNELPKLAKAVGIDVKTFNDCLASGRFKSKIEAQFTDGVNAGVDGTPTSFIILGDSVSKNIPKIVSDLLIQYRVPESILSIGNNGKIIVMRGALPSAMVNGLIGTIVGN